MCSRAYGDHIAPLARADAGRLAARVRLHAEMSWRPNERWIASASGSAVEGTATPRVATEWTAAGPPLCFAGRRGLAPAEQALCGGARA